MVVLSPIPTATLEATQEAIRPAALQVVAIVAEAALAVARLQAASEAAAPVAAVAAVPVLAEAADSVADADKLWLLNITSRRITHYIKYT